MTSPRQLTLEDDSIKHGAWSQQMVSGEYAVHYSSFPEGGHERPYCTVLGSLKDAVAYAQQQVEERPTLRCTIYNHEGFVGPPFKDIRGREFKDKDTMSPRFRRWLGCILFFGGAILTFIDWRVDFSLSWPAMIGTRMMVPGFGLLLIEAFFLLNERRKRTRVAAGERA